MSQCLQCHHQLTITRVECTACGVRSEGVFGLSRLARLPAEMQVLAEQILLAGGNLKEVSAMRSVSYPTLRKRMDGLTAALEALRESDEREVDQLLGEVETGRMRPEQAARIIKEMNHGS